MKPKTMILMVVAVGCGLGASYMTSRLLAERTNAPEEQEKIVILVAKKSLDTGVTIKEPQEMFAEKAVVKGEEPKNAIVKYDELTGRQLKRTLREGDFVSTGDLLSDKEALISYRLPEGHLAIGIRVNTEQIAGGFASLPLSRVDIFSTVRRPEDKQSFSQVLLQNVLVLAADQTTTREENKAMPAAVVTVALTPTQALKLTLAKEYGPITLALRKFNDNSKVSDNTKVTLENILTGGKVNIVSNKENPPVAPIVAKPEPVAAKPEPPKAPKYRRWVVTQINSGQEQWEYLLDEKDQVVSRRLLTGGETPRVDNAVSPAITPPVSAQPIGPKVTGSKASS